MDIYKLMKNLTIILIILSAILSILLFRQCEKVSELKNEAQSTKDFLSDSIRYYKNELGQEIAVKTALKGEKSALEVLLSKQIDSTGQLKALVKKFRKVDAAGNITTITKFDTIRIGYEVPILCEFHRDWGENTKWYKIAGSSNQNGILIKSLEVPNTLSFAIGKKKKGLFNSEYVIEAVNSNPNIKTVGLDSYSVKVPHKRLGVSIFAGYGISKDGLSPITGIGLSYQLLRF
jgi:hypothetical protein